MQTILIAVYIAIVIWYLELPFALFLAGYLFPIIFELMCVIYLKNLINSGFFLLKHSLLPACSILLAAMMSPDFYDVLD